MPTMYLTGPFMLNFQAVLEVHIHIHLCACLKRTHIVKHFTSSIHKVQPRAGVMVTSYMYM